ncbi:unnamed protein product [Prunus armeniaca]|uniref:Uncharacterized protein n=1 Tax=Prunus armeniaca TaxID=36596 RepID=A0A6J5VJQ8_PRUAR|nr:unnamed protein product [Prunus armeniaca]
MVAIAYCFSGLPTPSISPQGVVGHFPNLHCPSLTFAHLRTNFNTPMATTPFQVSASSSSSTIGAPDEENEAASSSASFLNKFSLSAPSGKRRTDNTIPSA